METSATTTVALTINANINLSSTQGGDDNDVVVNVDDNDNKCGTLTDQVDASDTNNNNSNAERYEFSILAYFFSSSSLKCKCSNWKKKIIICDYTQPPFGVVLYFTIKTLKKKFFLRFLLNIKGHKCHPINVNALGIIIIIVPIHRSNLRCSVIMASFEWI